MNLWREVSWIEMYFKERTRVITREMDGRTKSPSSGIPLRSLLQYSSCDALQTWDTAAVEEEKCYYWGKIGRTWPLIRCINAIDGDYHFWAQWFWSSWAINESWRQGEEKNSAGAIKWFALRTHILDDFWELLMCALACCYLL